jgi:hypothetical protein
MCRAVIISLVLRLLFDEHEEHAHVNAVVEHAWNRVDDSTVA